ncbi:MULTISPECIES: GreA/GreB family elongation factor [unclassified Thioalkalivibrio]|uniref:GreA/GreB family elongation factor n=1 Tax=unclassified Thioalkalivibrio TaxID=2621013 RepID=UPI00037C8B56|nr:MULTISPECIES: GreA/GreB family elongation factor [unclassified Thioalkalivibrio]
MARKNSSYLRQAYDSQVNRWVRQDYWGAIGTPVDLASLLEKIESETPHTDTAPQCGKVIQAGCCVRLLDLQTEETYLVELCEPEHAQPERGKISILSPLGSRLLGLRKNSLAEITLLRSRLRFLVIEILAPGHNPDQ